ncbi:hypothetical protein [Actinoplanes couchii]|nr:hypothetical protein [Actinoplanes couchii]
MQHRIRLVLEERRAARDAEPAVDLEVTMEIPPPQRVVEGFPYGASQR